MKLPTPQQYLKFSQRLRQKALNLPPSRKAKLNGLANGALALAKLRLKAGKVAYGLR
jgi:hypothetical protein